MSTYFFMVVVALVVVALVSIIHGLPWEDTTVPPITSTRLESTSPVTTTYQPSTMHPTTKELETSTSASPQTTPLQTSVHGLFPHEASSAITTPLTTFGKISVATAITTLGSSSTPERTTYGKTATRRAPIITSTAQLRTTSSVQPVTSTLMKTLQPTTSEPITTVKGTETPLKTSQSQPAPSTDTLLHGQNISPLLVKILSTNSFQSTPYARTHQPTESTVSVNTGSTVPGATPTRSTVIAREQGTHKTSPTVPPTRTPPYIYVARNGCDKMVPFISLVLTLFYHM